MVEFIDQHKHEFGIEPICAELPIAPSCYHDNKTRSPSKRQLQDEKLLPQVERVFAENYGVYGRRKVWVQLNREGILIGRDRCERLMKQAGLEGMVRGPKVRTTRPDPKGPSTPLKPNARARYQPPFRAGGPRRCGGRSYSNTQWVWDYLLWTLMLPPPITVPPT